MKPLEEVRFEQLIEWIEGQLAAEEAAAVARQLETADEATRSAVAWLQAFYEFSREVVLASPPDEVRRYLARQFEATVEQRNPTGFFSRLVATLTFDSHAQLVTVGARSAAAPGQERQLVYTTSLADVVLNTGTQGERLNLTGQVFPYDDKFLDDVYSVQLLHDAGEQAITSTDDLGEFTFHTIPPGVYDVVLSSQTVEVVILSVELRSQG